MVPVPIEVINHDKTGHKKKTRSDKFPLTLHKKGQYCKKIKGKLHCFGSEKQKALQRYLEHQESTVEVGELTARQYADQVQNLRKLVRFLGRYREPEQVSALDLQNYKKTLQWKCGSTHRINLHVSIMKAVCRWARENDITESIPNIDADDVAK